MKLCISMQIHWSWNKFSDSKQLSGQHPHVQTIRDGVQLPCLDTIEVAPHTKVAWLGTPTYQLITEECIKGKRSPTSPWPWTTLLVTARSSLGLKMTLHAFVPKFRKCSHIVFLCFHYPP